MIAEVCARVINCVKVKKKMRYIKQTSKYVCFFLLYVYLQQQF